MSNFPDLWIIRGELHCLGEDFWWKVVRISVGVNPRFVRRSYLSVLELEVKKKHCQNNSETVNTTLEFQSNLDTSITRFATGSKLTESIRVHEAIHT